MQGKRAITTESLNLQVLAEATHEPRLVSRAQLLRLRFPCSLCHLPCPPNSQTVAFPNMTYRVSDWHSCGQTSTWLPPSIQFGSLTPWEGKGYAQVQLQVRWLELWSSKPLCLSFSLGDLKKMNFNHCRGSLPTTNTGTLSWAGQ